MAELIVVGFQKDMFRASEALNMLKDMNNSWIVDLHDAVAVYRDYDGKLRVDQSYQIGGAILRQPVEDVLDGQYEDAAGSIRRRMTRSTAKSEGR